MLCKSQQKMLEMNAKLDNAYKSGMEKGFYEGMRNAIDILFYVTAYVLDIYEKENIYMSKNKIREIMKRINDNIDCFKTGQLTEADMHTIREEVKSNLEIALKTDKESC